MATKPSTTFLAIPSTDLSPIENRMAVDRLRSLIATNGAYIKSQDGVADEFADETGINLDIEGALIAQSTGTVIGDFTNGNYAFNSAIAAAGGTLATTTTATDQKIGKLYTTPIALASIEMKAPSNAGYVNGGNAITMTIMGSEDTTNGSDGTWVAISAATAVAMAAGSTNVITCTDTVTLFKGVVMNCTRTDGTTISVAEMEIILMVQCILIHRLTPATTVLQMLLMVTEPHLGGHQTQGHLPVIYELT